MTPREHEVEEALREHYAQQRTATCGADVSLARYAANDMTEEERAAFSSHLAACRDCAADLQSFAALPQEKTTRVPAAISSWRKWPTVAWWPPLGVVAAAAVILMISVDGGDRALAPPQSTLRAKGAWQLAIAVKRGDSVLLAHDGFVARDGDQLGFFYTGAEGGFFAVLFVDETGATSSLFPAEGIYAASVPGGTQVRLADGATLSAATGCEWVVAVHADAPFIIDAAATAAARAYDARDGCALGQLVVPSASIRVVGLRR